MNIHAMIHRLPRKRRAAFPVPGTTVTVTARSISGGHRFDTRDTTAPFAGCSGKGIFLDMGDQSAFFPWEDIVWISFPAETGQHAGCDGKTLKKRALKRLEETHEDTKVHPKRHGL